MGLLAVAAAKRNHLEQRSVKMTLSLALLSAESSRFNDDPSTQKEERSL